MNRRTFFWKAYLVVIVSVVFGAGVVLAGTYGFSVQGYSATLVTDFAHPTYVISYNSSGSDTSDGEPSASISWPTIYYGYSYLTSAAPVATYSVSGSTYASTYTSGPSPYSANGQSTSFSTIYNGNFFHIDSYSGIGIEPTNPDFFTTYVNSSGDTICDTAAKNSGLSTSASTYWCVVEVDSSGSPQTVTAKLFTSQPTAYTYEYEAPGTSTAITGSGTSGDPYVVTSTPYGNSSVQITPSTPANGLSGCYSSFNNAITGNYPSGPAANCYLAASTQQPPPPTITFSASPTSITRGNSSTLTWSAANANACTSTSFAVPSNQPAGSAIVSPTATTNYSITCTGTGGSSTSSATVTVTAPPTPTGSISANPTSIASGGSSTITWMCTNSTSSTGSNFSTGGAVSNSVTVSPTTTTTYSVTCNGAGGSVNIGSATVTVTAPVAPTGTFSANPTSITSGNSSTLTWMCTNSTSSTGTNFSTGGATAGSVSVSPTNTTTYSVVCSGTGGTTNIGSATVTVTAAAQALGGSCSVSTASATTGTPVTWTAYPTGGSGSFTYSWSGDESLSGSSASVSKTYATTGTKTATVVVTDATTGSSETVSCANTGNPGTITVTTATAADLTASGVTPATATAGTAVTLLATASNIGSASSGQFPILFKIGSTWIDSGYIGPIAPSTQAQGVVSYTFPSAGTYTVTACANQNTSGTAITGESNYSNDCGTPTTITVSAPATALSATCSVSPATAYVNQPITWVVNASGGTGTYTYNWGIYGGNVQGSSQTETTSYATPKNYTGTVQVTSGSASVNLNCFTSTGNSYVYVTNPPPTATLSASPATMRIGGSANLNWSETNASSCTINNGIGQVVPNGYDTTSGVVTVTPNSSTTYTLNCSSSNGTATATATVTVAVADLTAGTVTPTTTTTGTPTDLTATVTNTGNGPTSGSFPVLFVISNGDSSDSSYVPTLAGGASEPADANYTFTSPGTYTVQACANENASGTYVVTESNYANDCGTPTSVSVTSAAQPDLTAGAVSPTTATAGTPVTLYATATNIGNAATSGSFPVLFKIGSTWEDSSYIGPLTASGSAPGSLSYTFPTAGTYTVTACANQNTSGTFITSESDYTNDCGTPTTITVAAAPSAASLSCAPSPSSTSVNSNVIWTPTISGFSGTPSYVWSSSYGTPTSGSGSTFTNNYSSQGNYSVNVTATDAQGDNASASCSPVAVASGTGGSCGSPPAPVITATPARVDSGQTVTITYSASGAQSTCTVTGPGVTQPIVSTPDQSCNVSGGSFTTQPITTQSVYTMNCGSGSGTKTVTVNIKPSFSEF